VLAPHLVKSGVFFALGLSFDEHGPQSGGLRFNPIHLMSMTPADNMFGSESPDGLISAADDVIIMPLQCATQWDSLAHIGYDGLLYNNTPASAVRPVVGATRNSFANACTRLISRGVLLDIPRLKGVDRLDAGVEITADDLSAAEARQRVTTTSGDILLVRTGFYQHFLEGDKVRYMGSAPGLGVSTLEWLHTREVAAIVADTTAVEVFPSTEPTSIIPFHLVAIRDIGLTLGEMFNLEELAVSCEQDGISEFLFCGPGLKISNSVGSPVTPVAIK
jgi:kynurenine formamidase